MKTSESVENIFKAVIGFESEMEAVHKGAENPYFKSKYADLPSIIEATKPLLKKHGLGIIQGADSGDMGLIQVQTRLIHESGEWVEVEVPMLASKQDPQACGSCVTYGRRYGIQAILNLSSDDDDAESASQRPSSKKPIKDVNREVKKVEPIKGDLF